MPRTSLKTHIFRNTNRRTFNVLVQMNWAGLLVFERVLVHTPPKWFMEIGTGTGGTSLFLALWCRVNHARFATIDIAGPRNNVLENLQHLGADVWKGSCWDDDWRTRILEYPGGEFGVLFCDGGDKAREMREYGVNVPSGTIVFSHDYGIEWQPSDVPPELVPYEPWHSQSLEMDTKLAVYKRR